MTFDYELIDVCHTIDDGMITYKGLPAPVIKDHLSREASKTHYAARAQSFTLARLKWWPTLGPTLIAPFIAIQMEQISPDWTLYTLANLDGLLIRHDDKDKRAIDVDSIKALDVKGKAVLFQTNWDLHWRTEEYWSGRHPFLTEATAQLLAESGAALVGIDSYNIDNTQEGTRPVHSILLRHNIPIVEHLCGLRELPNDVFKFFAVPVKVRNFGTFPVRAFAIVPKK